MPDFNWNHLQTFLAVARSGRLTTAAARLASDHTTLSRRISSLEQALDAKLFERRPTGYVLTPDGERLMPMAEEMERVAMSAHEGVAGAALALTGTVRIGVPEGFGSYFLAPRIATLARNNPGLTLQLIAGPNLYSLAKRDADVIVTLSRPSEGRLYARKLTDYRLRLYAAPAYLEAQPAIGSAADLEHHRFIGYIADLLHSAELDYLHQINPAICTAIESSNLVAQLRATVAGAGLCVLPDFIVAARGGSDLVPVLPDQVNLTRSLWMVSHADLKDLARIKLTMGFIADEVRAARRDFLGSA